MSIASQRTQRVAEVSFTMQPQATERIWNCALTPILDREKPLLVRFMLISAIEITEQVQIRKELERLDVLKDDFLSLAAHELRTPLTSIQGNAQILLRNLKKSATQAAGDDQAQTKLIDLGSLLLDRVIRQIHQMNKLISEMLDVTRMRADLFSMQNLYTVDLSAVIQRTIEQTRSDDRTILFQTSEATLYVTIDTDRIEQVMNNLLSNASKYSPADTPIRVSITRSTTQPEEAIIAIQDEGHGIQEEDQAHIFEHFYRIRSKEAMRVDGLGLGLYIAHEIVSQHGGRLWVTSKPQQGSTFFFSLPLAR